MKEAQKRAWEEFDVILISGDAYVDHPAFGTAVVSRIIEDEGLRIGIVAQPNWKDDLRDFKKLGKPKLFFGVTAGCMDSMVNHYTANKRLRSTDAYTGWRSGFSTRLCFDCLFKYLKHEEKRNSFPLNHKALITLIIFCLTVSHVIVLSKTIGLGCISASSK